MICYSSASKSYPIRAISSEIQISKVYPPQQGCGLGGGLLHHQKIVQFCALCMGNPSPNPNPNPYSVGNPSRSSCRLRYIRSYYPYPHCNRVGILTLKLIIKLTLTITLTKAYKFDVEFPVITYQPMVNSVNSWFICMST